MAWTNVAEFDVRTTQVVRKPAPSASKVGSSGAQSYPFRLRASTPMSWSFDGRRW